MNNVFGVDLMADYSYEPGSNGKCPHCGRFVCFEEPTTAFYNGMKMVDYSDTMGAFKLENDKPVEEVIVYAAKCPNSECHKPVVTASIVNDGKKVVRLVYPFNISRVVSLDVPNEISKDFLEAASVLPVSEKASAALSRRCLQSMLSDKNYKAKDLSAQIDLAIKALPTNIAENLDAIRQIGNFAAHPMKTQSTGEIVDVEPEEANWNLDVLEELFDFFYVQPKIAQQKRVALNAKLQGLGKPPLKKP